MTLGPGEQPDNSGHVASCNLGLREVKEIGKLFCLFDTHLKLKCATTSRTI